MAHAIARQASGDELRLQGDLMRRIQASLTDDQRDFSGEFGDLS